MTAGLHIQLVDVLLSDNESLRKTLSTVAEEKAELCRAVSKLEKTLKHHLLKGCALSVGPTPRTGGCALSEVPHLALHSGLNS